MRTSRTSPATVQFSKLPNPSEDPRTLLPVVPLLLSADRTRSDESGLPGTHHGRGLDLAEIDFWRNSRQSGCGDGASDVHMGGGREADASGHGVQVVDTEFLILRLTLAACGDFLSQLLDVLFRHLGLCEDFGTKVVNVAGVIGDEQAIGLLISHVTSPLQSMKRNPRAQS